MRKITFFSTINGVADAFPIQPARNFKFNWVDSVREDFKSQNERIKREKVNHLARCPGVNEIMNIGYIIPMPWDITIETDGDLLNFGWSIPSKDIQDIFDSPVITAHHPNGVAKGLPIKPNAMESIIKLNTPWHAIVPEGVKFLMIPIPYPDTFEFENVSGVLDVSISSEINFQLRWYVTEGIHTIKAGTPMVQLIPMTEEKFDLEVRNVDENDKIWLEKRRYLNNCTFTMKRNLIQSLYRKFFKR
jgi:hypothetical protein